MDSTEGYVYWITYEEFKATYPNDVDPQFGIFTFEELGKLIEK